MNKIKSILFLFLVLFFLTQSCGFYHLNNLVKECDKECPINVGSLIKINRLSMKDDEVVFKMNIEVQVTNNLSNHKNDVAKLICAGLRKRTDNNIIEAIVEEHTKTIFDISDVQGNKWNLSYSSNELGDAYNSIKTLNDDKLFIIQQILQLRLLTPIRLSSNVILKDVFMTENRVSYIQQVDGYDGTADNGMVKALLKSQLAQNAKEIADTHKLLETLKKNNMDICYDIISSSGRRHYISFNKTEIDEILNDDNTPLIQDWLELIEKLDKLNEVLDDDDMCGDFNPDDVEYGDTTAWSY